MSEKVPVSVIVPIKNEANNLERCLSALRWANEIFVVDSMSTDGSIEIAEGCLSVPGFYEPVNRFQTIQLHAIDRDGKPYTMEASDLLAVCIQHEMDHLEGKLFVDYLSNAKRSLIRRKLQKLQKQRA